MEYCCHVWAGAPNCYLELLDKLQKPIRRIVGPSLAASLEPLPHRRNVASLSVFCIYYFGKFSSELVKWFHFLILEGGLLIIILVDCNFSVTIPRCYKDVCQQFLSSYS